MKRAVTIALTQDGKWETLSYPDTSIMGQKVSFKEKKVDEETASKYREILIFDKPSKKAKYPNIEEQAAARKAMAKMQAEAKKEADKKAKEAAAKKTE